tara:strand:+ start:4281 stop:4445 length:165 start_codon:yes stop_codon:yes gene_type:complete
VNLTKPFSSAAFAVKPAPLFQGAESDIAAAKALFEMQFVNRKKMRGRGGRATLR